MPYSSTTTDKSATAAHNKVSDDVPAQSMARGMREGELLRPLTATMPLRCPRSSTIAY